MIAALGTLAFLTTLWLLVVVGATILEESGTKIAAALRGEAAIRTSVSFAPMRVRTRGRVQKAMLATARWRAAA